MQLFVTDPVLGTVMLVSKLLMGWLLLRCEIRAERKRRVQMLHEGERSLELSELKSVGDVKVVNAKLEALKVVARGDEDMIEVERRKKLDEKVRAEGKLVAVGESIEEARVDGLKGVVKELKKDERDMKTSLRAVEVALEALQLFGTEGAEAEELLVEAKRERSQLKTQLKRIRLKKGRVGVQRTRFVEVGRRETSGTSKNMRKIVPVVHQLLEMEDIVDEEP